MYFKGEKSKIQGKEAKFHGGGFLWYEAFKMKLGCNAYEKMRGPGKKHFWKSGFCVM